MAEVGHALGVSEAFVNVFSQNYVDFANCKIAAADLEGSTEYIVIVSALVMHAIDTRNEPRVRLEAGGSTFGDSVMRFESRTTTSSRGEHYFYMQTYTTPSTPVDIQMQGTCVTSPTIVVRCVNFFGVAIKLSDLTTSNYAYDSNTTNITNLSNASWSTTNSASITIGDGSSDWLVFGHARVAVDNVGTEWRMRLTDDGTQVGEYVGLEGADTADERQWGGMWVLEAIPSSTIRLEFQTDSGTPGQLDVWHNRIFALRLNAFEDFLATHDTTDVEIAALDTDYGNISVSHTTSTAATRDWAVFGNSIISKGGRDGHYRHSIKDGSTTLVGAGGTDTKQVFEGSTAYVPNLKFGEYASVANNTALTATIKNQEDIDIVPTPDIIDAHIAWFTWELAPAASGRTMGALAGDAGLAGPGGLAGRRGGLAG